MVDPIAELHPDLAFWCLPKTIQTLLLVAARSGCSAQSLVDAYAETYKHMTEETSSQECVLVGYYLGGLIMYQERNHLQ